jgi:hypothetical protein
LYFSGVLAAAARVPASLGRARMHGFTRTVIRLCPPTIRAAGADPIVKWWLGQARLGFGQNHSGSGQWV